MVTSGGMECIPLACQALLDPGDASPSRRPTYLGALMAFARFEADLAGDPDGRATASRSTCSSSASTPGCGRSCCTSSPSSRTRPGRTLHARAPPRARRAVPPPRRAHPRGRRLPRDVLRRRRAAVAVVAGPRRRRAGGHVLEDLRPGVRLGWAVGPARRDRRSSPRPSRPADQCAWALGQRIVEAYGRAGHFERQIPAVACALRGALAGVEARCASTCRTASRWSEPAGGFFTWLTLPAGSTPARCAPAARGGRRLRPRPPVLRGRRRRERAALLFSFLPEDELAEAVARLAGVIGTAAGV